MTPVARFNRICAWIALAWLMGGTPLTEVLRPSYQDVASLYSAGLVARLGAWGALYANLANDTTFRVGQVAEPRPALARLIAQRHMVDTMPFLDPPTAAVLLYPLGWLSFSAAHWAWIFLLCFSSWSLAMFGGSVYAGCAGEESKGRGGVVLLTAFSLLTYRCIRVQNLSPLVALCLIVSVFSFIAQSRTGRSLWGGLAMTIGGGLKFASAALVPLALAMRQWRTLAVATALSAALLLASCRMAGRATFEQYLRRIGPSLARSTDTPSNKSLQGFLLRATGVTPLPPTIRLAYRALEATTLAALLWLIFRQPQASWRLPPRVFAASAALIGWMLIFSPMCWEHYFCYLCPFWGWLIWEAQQGPWRRVAALTTIATQWVPLPVNPWVSLPEPVNSYMLWGLVLMFGLAVARLTRTSAQSAQ